MKTYKYHYVYTITNPTILDENNKPKVSLSIRSVDCNPKDDNFYGTAKITMGTPIIKLIKKIISVWKTKEEAKKAKNKMYHQLNSSKVSQRKKKYYAENIDKIMEYKSTNKERINKRQAEYHERNKVEINARKKIYSQENVDKIKERKHKYYIDNKVEINTKTMNYQYKKKEEYYIVNKEKIEAEKKLKIHQRQEKIEAEKKLKIHQRQEKIEATKKRYAHRKRINGNNYYSRKRMNAIQNKIKNGNNGGDWIFYTLLLTHTETGISFYKYGITSRSIAMRIEKFTGYSIVVLDSIVGDKYFIKSLERIHLIASKPNAVVFDPDIPEMKMSGYTECRSKLAESIPINVK